MATPISTPEYVPPKCSDHSNGDSEGEEYYQLVGEEDDQLEGEEDDQLEEEEDDQLEGEEDDQLEGGEDYQLEGGVDYYQLGESRQRDVTSSLESCEPLYLK